MIKKKEYIILSINRQQSRNSSSTDDLIWADYQLLEGDEPCFGYMKKQTMRSSISTAERKKKLSRPRPTEDAISAEAHRWWHLGRGSQKMLSRPKLTERAISTEAYRTCYLGRGSQKMLSRSRLTADAISVEAHRLCYRRRVYSSSNFVVVALRAP